MIDEILIISNPMIRETALPDFACASPGCSERVGISALDELDGMLQRHVISRSEEQMDMFGHNDERVDLKAPFAAIAIQSLKEKANVILDYEQSPALPS